MQRREWLKSLGVFGAWLGGFVGTFGTAIAASVENKENTQIWTTADGRKIRIIDMDDNHLRNTIIYMAKYHGYSSFAISSKHNNTWLSDSPSTTFPYYDAMRREANRRKLPWI
jgi:hypothetical protein